LKEKTGLAPITCQKKNSARCGRKAKRHLTPHSGGGLKKKGKGGHCEIPTRGKDPCEDDAAKKKLVDEKGGGPKRQRKRRGRKKIKSKKNVGDVWVQGWRDPEGRRKEEEKNAGSLQPAPSIQKRCGGKSLPASSEGKHRREIKAKRGWDGGETV